MGKIDWKQKQEELDYEINVLISKYNKFYSKDLLEKYLQIISPFNIIYFTTFLSVNILSRQANRIY